MILLALILTAGVHPAKVPSYATTVLPVCDTAHDTWVVFDDTALKFKRCNGSTWSIVDLGGGSTSVPAGTIVMITSGTCATGFTEVSALNGKTLIGTIASNADVGTTGGNDSITPAGTVATGIFTGTPFSSIINHTHPLTITSTSRVQGGTTASTTGTHIMTSSSTGGSARAPTSGDLFTGTSGNPTGGVTSITPAGTIGSQAFTGNSFDNRSAFIKVIFCSKN